MHARTAALALMVTLGLALGCSSSSGGGGDAAAAVDPLEIVPELLRPASVTIGANPVTMEAPPADAASESLFLRYRQTAGAPVSAILILIPGTNGGAGTFDYMARKIVGRSGGAVEVWAFERRSNALEDRRGGDAAEEAGDFSIADDYYLSGAELPDGSTFDGFLTNETASYLSEFGLDVVMRDLWSAIELVPEANRATNVFIGGHSLGASQTMTFLGWDFDGDDATTDDAGYANVAGAFLIEGASFGGAIPPASQSAYEASLQALRDGSSPVFGGFPGITPAVTAYLEAAGMRAHPDFGVPEEESTIGDLDLDPSVELLLNFLVPADPLGALLGFGPTFRDYRFTNEALLGLVLDDQFQFIGAQQTSLGFPSPPEGTADAQLLGIGLGARGLSDTAPLYTWTNYDEVDGIDPAFTTPVEEVSDITRTAEVQYRGPTNFSEWYFALRPGLDASATGGLANLTDDAWQSEVHDLNLFHTSKIDVPIFALGGLSGLTPDEDSFASSRAAIADPDRNGNPRDSSESFEILLVPGVNPLDVLVADDEIPGGNGFFEDMVDFMLNHAEGTVVVP